MSFGRMSRDNADSGLQSRIRPQLMRVLVVSQYFWPENFRINDLVVELRDRGYDVTVLTGKPNYPSGTVFAEFERCPESFANYAGIEIIRVPMLARSRGAVRLLLNYLSFVVGAVVYGPGKIRKRSFDVIFVYEPSPVTVALPAIFFGSRKNIPVVFWVLDLWPETLVALGVVRSKWLLGLISRCVKFIYDRCTLVLGQSRGFVPSISRYCSDPSKVRYYPSWAEDVFSGLPSQRAPEVPVAEGMFTVVFAGNVGESQDMPAVVEAAWILRDEPRVRWVIVGDGRKSDWLKSEIEQRGLGGKVMLAGRYPIDRMPSFYAHADALLVSLKRDPVFSLVIPAKLQTYLAAGIPVLGMLDGEGARVIHEARAGLCCPAGDAAGLADCVVKMMSLSQTELSAMGNNGRRYIAEEFDRGQLISRLEDFFREAIELHSRSRH